MIPVTASTPNATPSSQYPRSSICCKKNSRITLSHHATCPISLRRFHTEAQTEREIKCEKRESARKRKDQEESDMGSSADGEDFSVVVLASDLGVDARPFLANQDREIEEQENWYDCPQNLISDEDFSDLELLQFFSVEGQDKSGNRIFRIVGKYFPAPVVSADRLKRYIFHKLCSEVPEGPYSIVYMHSTVQKEDNSPGITILRWLYEDLPSYLKDRLQVVYFVHPGLRSRLVFATLGRFFLTGGLYWKIKYVSRLQYLWDDIKKGEVEIPEFVKNHDDVLEHRPLTDYGIEPDPLHMLEAPSTAYSFGRYEERWTSREYTS
ncbi:hypothetical protein DVH24_004889 [Malus domestica]|uniref:CRAL-TRIO domain-containing protein n=4 Tax=Amygdaloideae TaxID=171637 RepID=A0A498IFS5_MALDO|nr:hypothetical protein DVH24_004889 [Malus domestica]